MLSLADRLARALRDTLADATAALEAQSARSKASAIVYADMSKAMTETLVPHAVAAMKWLFAKEEPNETK